MIRPEIVSSTRDVNQIKSLAYLHTMALSFFISLFVTYTYIANRQTTNIFFGFLGIHSSDARKKKRRKKKKNNSKILYESLHPDSTVFCEIMRKTGKHLYGIVKVLSTDPFRKEKLKKSPQI